MYCKTAALYRSRSTPTGLPSGVVTGLVKFRYGLPSIDENSSPDACGKPVSSALRKYCVADSSRPTLEGWVSRTIRPCRSSTATDDEGRIFLRECLKDADDTLLPLCLGSRRVAEVFNQG